MTLAQYRRKFPNIDWTKPSPAAEFAMTPADRKRHRKWLLNRVAAQCTEIWDISWPGHGNAVLRHVRCRKLTKHSSGKCHHHRPPIT